MKTFFALIALSLLVLADANWDDCNKYCGWRDSTPGNMNQWMAILATKNWKDQSYQEFCRGTLINPKWVLTSAHCVSGKSQRIYIGLGGDDMSTVSEYNGVEKVVIHPNYNDKSFHNDVALVKLDHYLIVGFGSRLSPICLPLGDDKFTNGTVFGQSSSELGSEIKILDGECEKIYTGTKQFDKKSQICGSKIDTESCSYDNGAALTVEKDGRSYLIGTVSYGVGCPKDAPLGVYSRITQFEDWIRKIADNGDFC